MIELQKRPAATWRPQCFTLYIPVTRKHSKGVRTCDARAKGQSPVSWRWAAAWQELDCWRGGRSKTWHRPKHPKEHDHPEKHDEGESEWLCLIITFCLPYALNPTLLLPISQLCNINSVGESKGVNMEVYTSSQEGGVFNWRLHVGGGADFLSVSTFLNTLNRGSFKDTRREKHWKAF